MNRKLTVNVDKPQNNMDTLYGIFFEDINHAADGGLYGELVRNRSFEFCPVDNPSYHGLTAWEKVEQDGKVRLQIETGNPVHPNNPHYLAMDIVKQGEDVGVWNVGYNTGIPLREKESYNFCCYVKREQDLECPCTVSLRSKEGAIYAEKTFLADMEWKKIELELTSPVTDFEARLTITAKGYGKVYLDFVSLFPKNTFLNKRWGFRRDLAEMIADLKPRFMRFPGGCLVHVGSLDENARDSQYRWKNTLGEPEGRPPRKNVDYNQTLGIGYMEYFEFCKEIGTKPIPVFSAGYDPHSQKAAPLDRMQPWIDDVLDLISFATEGEDTYWGRKRIELGHSEPFPLDTIAIGNEEVGEAFFERYAIIHQAVKEKYPWIKIINSAGPYAEGEGWERGWKSADEWNSEYVDEHYYQSPEWFIGNQFRYDAYSREKSKVFLGEYASKANKWKNALAEASYMIGLERNADIVKYACYAPLLCNVDYVQWNPDMIWFNNHQVYGTPNYYVQKLFMNHHGDVTLDYEYEDKIQQKNEIKTIQGGIILESLGSDILIKEMEIENIHTGEKIVLGDYRIEQGGKENILEKLDWSNYRIRLLFTEMDKEDERDGFRLLFGRRDADNWYAWDAAVGDNRESFVVESNSGIGYVVTQHSWCVTRGRTYCMELEVNDSHICTYVDGKKMHDTISQPMVIAPLYLSAVLDKETGDVIIKGVNMQDKPVAVDIDFSQNVKEEAEVFYLQCNDLDTENSFEEPEKIAIQTRTEQVKDGILTYTFEPYSVNILRMGTDPA